MYHGFAGRLTGMSLVAFAAAFAASTLACGSDRGNLSKEQEEQGLYLPDSTSTTRRITMDRRCELNELVLDPKPDTPEWVMYQLLEASSSAKDDDASFQKFYSHFDESKAESWVRQQYWPRARDHVAKYLEGDATEGVTFRICERRKEAEGKVKLFIKSNDPKKSNPPTTFQKDDSGKWKVVFFTP
ncbi:MAG: hypothetical protein CSA66_02330 [Proteobacteria bacterium]|nr:MAG: hypothetical protein CSA66_02330 [Pseudomonadota bacterium]